MLHNENNKARVFLSLDNQSDRFAMDCLKLFMWHEKYNVHLWRKPSRKYKL